MKILVDLQLFERFILQGYCYFFFQRLSRSMHEKTFLVNHFCLNIILQRFIILLLNINVHGYNRISPGLPGSPWISPNFLGCPWISLYLQELLKVSKHHSRCARIFQDILGFPKIIKDLQGSVEISKNHSESPRISQVVSGSPRIF